MSKVILHIGTHKTATTTIQNTFAANAPLLRDNGLIYPVFTRGTGHHGLVYTWAAMPKYYQLDGGGEVGLRWLGREFAGGDLPVFLSSEEFSRGQPDQASDFEAIRALLAPFDEIEVICCLRSQWQFIQSVYLEISKGKQPGPPEDYVKRAIETGMIEGLHADYNRLLDRLETAFRPEEITLVPFETAVAVAGGIVGWMLRHLGLPLRATDLAPVDGGSSNVSMPALAGWAANRLAAPRPARGGVVTRALDAYVDEFGAKTASSIFSRAEFDTLKAHFDALNLRVQERRVYAQPGLVLPSARVPQGTVFRDDPRVAPWFERLRTPVAQA